MKIITGILLLVTPLAAQLPRLTHANLQGRAVSGDPRADFDRSLAAQSGAAWFGYGVPMIAGENQMCHNRGLNTIASPVHLEGPRTLMVLYRMENHALTRIHVYSEDCELDAGGLPVTLLSGVKPSASVALLASIARKPGEQKRTDEAITAIALHADSSADDALEAMVKPDQDERLREKAVFWLGVTRGARGYAAVKNVLTHDPSDKIREKAVFAMSLSKEPKSVADIIEVAKNDRSPHVRGQALFWLAQKAGKQATSAIANSLENDPETEVKTKAVFALQQLPKDEGVPLLIQTARNNRNPEVRKQAMFWLGQSNDSRALAFFESVLK